MKSRFIFVGISLCLLVGLLISGSAVAHPSSTGYLELGEIKNTFSILSSTAEVDFPSKLTFNITVDDDVNITDIRLRYTLDRDSFASVFSEAFVEFNPSTSVGAGWVLDMQKAGGLPPGSTVNYWWVVKDANGRRFESSTRSIEFNDNRFKWRNIQEENVTLYWYNGNDVFARQLMNTAQQALTRLENSTGAKLIRPIKIYIYANAQDLRGSMIFPSEWTGGVSFTQFAIIAIGISPSNLSWGETAIAHELTHLAVHQATFNPYGDLPVWLDEGLAAYNEGKPDPSFASVITEAINSKQLISLRSLSSPFSAYTNKASLSYAESHSVVSYLINTYGQSKMVSLLNVFEQGSTYDDAFKKVYGFDMDQLYASWKQTIGAQ